MEEDDKQDKTGNIRIDKEVKNKLENLDFVKEHDSELFKVHVKPSDIIKTLISFYDSNKPLFRKWREKKKKR